eukprot:109784_1
MSRKANKKHAITPEMLQIGITKVMEKTEDRLLLRADRIENIINEQAVQHNQFKPYWTGFKINNKNKLIHNSSSILQTWDGGKYDKPITDNKQCFQKTRNFWCREKYKPIGSKLFYPIFCQLYQYIDGFGGRNVCDTDKILLFIDIMDRLLAENIKFVRTSAKPVILHATFFKANKFKDFCGAFLEIFNNSKYSIEWGAVKVTKSVRKTNNDRATSQYIRDPNRATDLHDSFVTHLKNIKLQIINCNNMNTIKHSMKRFMDWIRNNGDTVSNMIPMKEDMKENDEEIEGNGDMKIINDNSNNIHWAPNIGYITNSNGNNNSFRTFQSTNHFINGPNRIHNNINMYRMNNSDRNNNRHNARELHIQQMRMSTLYHNHYYPYVPNTCCCNCNYIVPFNTVHYTHMPQVSQIQLPPIPISIQHIPPVIPYVYAPNTAAAPISMPQITNINQDEIQSTCISRSPMNISTNSFAVTPPQGPQTQTQSVLPESIGSNINNNSNSKPETETVITFRSMNNNNNNNNNNNIGDLNGNNNSILDQIAYNSIDNGDLNGNNNSILDQIAYNSI